LRRCTPDARITMRDHHGYHFSNPPSVASMRVIELRPKSDNFIPTTKPNAERQRQRAVRELSYALLGSFAGKTELPSLKELAIEALALADGRRRRSVLPLAQSPTEYTLLRDGDHVLVSCYDVSPGIEVLVLDRQVPITELLTKCSAAMLATASTSPDSTTQAACRELAERLGGVAVVDTSSGPHGWVHRTSGTVDRVDDGPPLSFGFHVSIAAERHMIAEASARADVYPLLFQGTLWACIRGRRMPLVKGPIMPATLRMVQAVQTMIEAWERGRAANVRLRSGRFSVGLRLSRAGEVALTVKTDEGQNVTVPALDVPGTALPILKLASDLARALVNTDRSQVRNLRVSGLRDEVRALRRAIGRRHRSQPIVNQDPDRLRWTMPEQEDAEWPSHARASEPSRRLRFAERWRAEVGALDAASTFLCGDRLIVATPHDAIAVSRDDGTALWERQDACVASWMAGTVLVRLSPSGEISLCDTRDGETYARTRIALPSLDGLRAKYIGGGDIPPMVVVGEGDDRLVAVDLRTAEPRWRFHGPRRSGFRMKRAGRLLITVAGGSEISAIDVISGEVIWRYLDGSQFWLDPAVSRHMVITVATHPGHNETYLYGIDLFSGQLTWRRPLAASPSGGPMQFGPSAAIALGDAAEPLLASFDPASGNLRWMVPDPGVNQGGSCMAFDSNFVVNTPSGRIAAMNVDSGLTLWTRTLSHPVADEIPRRLEPVLRSGALFVPSATVHVLRPSDGEPLGGDFPCDLIPDFLRVDERSWVYVAEESGLLQAFAPTPHLELVRA
jgi:outer membrane protein assembly factor BamB